MVISHWSANVAVLAAVAAVVGAYLVGTRLLTGQAKREGHASPAGSPGQVTAFCFGLATVLIALVSPVGYWAQRLIWVRSLQDLLLVEVAPALIVLGAPWLALARGARPWRARSAGPGPRSGEPGALPGSSSDRFSGGRTTSAWPTRRSILLTWPGAITVLVNVAWCAWHVPGLYDAALRSVWMYAAEVVIYLGLGIAFWLQLIGSGPVVPKFAPVRRVILMAGTVVVGTVLGMALAFGSGLLYPAYLASAHGLDSALADQQLGGAVLWVLSLPPFAITAVALLSRWLKEEESDALTAGLDRLLKPPTSAWPSRPGL